jgi:hypothetical protein
MASFLALSFGVVKQQAPLSREYQVKAVFLFNFCQFVEFPSDAFAQPESPLVIGIYGKDPFRNYLDETVAGEKINGHPLTVERYKTIDEIKGCHILFINTEKKDELKFILEHLQNQPVLTVGDVPNFAKRGGIVRFFTEENKTRIRVNLEAAKRANLTISAKLLRLAEIVNPGDN